MAAKYDTVRLNYADFRIPDPRIAAVIHDALDHADTVLNVGAGTVSYEPVGRSVTAVEPSPEMIWQRSPLAAKVIQASADNLPFDDDAFDAAMSILPLRHWPDKAVGLRVMRRVTTGRIVLLTYDPCCGPWLTD